MTALAPDAVKALAGDDADVVFQRNLYQDPNHTRRQLHWDRRRFVMDRVARLASRDDKVLEIGIGCGIFTESMAEMGLKVNAVDIHPGYLRNIAGRQNVEVHCKDATEPLGLGEHRLVLCSEVLEHVPPSQSEALIRTAFASLQPGGHFVLTTPQRWSTVELATRLFRFPLVLALARRLYGHAEELGHINLLTAGALEKQIANVGFEIVEQRRFGLYLPLIAEAGGRPGARLLKAIEGGLRPLPFLRGLLWTQGYVLRKPR